ncbi:hypothetical protein HZH66_014110 [Vespula vulgaris]|uniref:Uncharacterized protein n=1 Tax=Vespula vulgaris TaxID=7454 RepID=A0A834MR93_VESVU|nr:hypothetical protein HZH66_014110 [Vespula vulgaris]
MGYHSYQNGRHKIIGRHSRARHTSENVRKLRNPNRPQLLDLIGRKEEEKEEKGEEHEEDEDEEMEKEEEEEEEEEERVEEGDAAGPFLSMHCAIGKLVHPKAELSHRRTTTLDYGLFAWAVLFFSSLDVVARDVTIIMIATTTTITTTTITTTTTTTATTKSDDDDDDDDDDHNRDDEL